MKASLRHLRLVLAVAATGSITRAAQQCHISQPAVTTAIAGIEATLCMPIFDRRPGGFSLTAAGHALSLRIHKALAVLDPALADLSPRLIRTASIAQLNALIAVAETESFAAAARRLGLAQPTVHRAVSQIEREVGHHLFDRKPHGVIPTRALRHLAMAARLAFVELDLALADVADLAGQEVGRVVIGAMPLSRSVLLGPAIALFRAEWRTLPVRVVEGPYAELVLGLRRGETDFLVGALRPETVDLAQEMLFQDAMAIVTRPGHPALRAGPALDALAGFAWVIAPEGTPARDHFTAMFSAADHALPLSLVETGSMALLTDLVRQTDHLGFVSARQVAREISAGRLAAVPFQPQGTSRPIGLTTRRGWCPTRAQAGMVAAIRLAAGQATAA